jgi:hypothetical protein
MQSTLNKSQTEQAAQQKMHSSDQKPQRIEYLPISDNERESLRSFGVAAIILTVTTLSAIALRWLIGD